MEFHLKKILEAAIRSPSGDNCQPFRFKIVEVNTIQIFHSNKAAQHFFNSNNFASLIALGTVIESISIEARGLGYIPTVNITANVGSITDDYCWATVELTPTSMPLSENLIGAFESRWTCRTSYRTEKLSDEVVLNCKNQAAKGSSDIEVFYGKPQIDEFINYLQETEFVIWDHQTAAKDLLKMFRFPDHKNPKSYDDGIANDELGVSTIEMLTMRLLHNYPSILPLLFYFGFKSMAKNVTKNNYLNCGGVIAFASASNKDPKLVAVETGRAAMRVWLSLNQQGYVVQPLTSGSMLCFQYENKVLNSPIKDKFKEIFNQGQNLWRRIFNIPEKFRVVWVFRVGLPLQNIQRHRSKRWKLEDLVL